MDISFPLMNDYDVLIHNDLRYNRTYDCCITTSLLASQIIAHTYSMPLHKFQVLGFSRNDNLLSNEKNEKLENFIKQSADYPIKRVILYTPTHRDYERDIHTNVRSILGFEVNCQKLSALLKQYNALIICKFILDKIQRRCVKNCLMGLFFIFLILIMGYVNSCSIVIA